MALDLSVFTKNSIRFGHPAFSTLYLTDGVRHVGEQADAWWLLDHIGKCYLNYVESAKLGLYVPPDRNVFQVWKITYFEEEFNMCIELYTKDDELLWTKWVDDIDGFPITELTIWITDNVLLLPSEW